MPESTTLRPDQPDWWRGAVIYQIYLRSFMNAVAVPGMPAVTPVNPFRWRRERPSGCG
ncbi:hypothetical protein OM427_08875 [Halomonas sp. 18H]|uniref:hypothetical protein n=1 Tax=Halomonas almeriensis TaxID=308163 RepID=UPI00223234A3|nr:MULTISPECIES: hypothetical protein [Halomonas]MCW4149642.1 hypothetical protein [Halomonas sp. 18H]MDN3553413.1 hypothetical protein [Halomonas almeriensis]